MNPVREALYEALSGATAVTNLLADGTGGVYHKEAPANAQTPFVILAKQSGRRQWTFEDSLRWDRWLVKAVDRKRSGVAEDIDEAVDVLLSDLTLTITGRRHLFLRRETDVDYPEQDGAETYRHVGGIYGLVTQKP